MVDTVAVTASEDAKLIGDFGNVRQKVADLKTRFPPRAERLDRTQERVLGELEPCDIDAIVERMVSDVRRWMAEGTEGAGSTPS